MDYKRLDNCISCGESHFSSVIDLGDQFVVDFVNDPKAKSLKAPLHLVRCVNCHLVQLTHQVNADRLYKKFWYRSGINESMRQALRDVAATANLCVWPKKGDKVLDIGCNDGTLLELYPDKLITVGVDPAADLVDEAVTKGRADIGIKDYFKKERLIAFAPFKIITAISMFYDLSEPLQFLKDCQELLDEDGVLIIQMNYLKTMLDDTAFDNICHEHLTYYSLLTMCDLVERAGLEVNGADLNSVNGGSIRIFITQKGKSLHGMPVDKQVRLHANKMALLVDEQEAGLDTDKPYRKFAREVTAICQAIRDYIMPQEDVYVYGASTRGSTLMQTLNLPAGVIKGAAERDENKLGLYTVGTNIPIFAEEFCRQQASTFLVLPWHFMETIKRREDAWLANGGTMLVPLPKPYILSYEDQEVETPLHLDLEVEQ